MNSDLSTDANMSVSLTKKKQKKQKTKNKKKKKKNKNKKKNRMANSVDPDETARLIWIYTICSGIGFGLPGLKGLILLIVRGSYLRN